MNGKNKKSDERRKKPRVYERIKAKVLEGHNEQEGLVLDQSEDGLFFHSSYQFTVGSTVTIKFDEPDYDVPELTGQVKWLREHDHNALVPQPAGAGIELILSPEKYLQFVSNLRSQSSRKKRGQDIRHDLVCNVSFIYEGKNLTESSVNISYGGHVHCHQRGFKKRFVG